LLGVYDNFPELYHCVAEYSHSTQPKRLQRAIIEAAHGINRNGEGPSLPEFKEHGITVIVDLGVADGVTFTYVDSEVFNECLEAIEKKAFETLDFICIVRYYNVRSGRRRPLKFDYHMVRFTFRDKAMGIIVYHERGVRHLAIMSLVDFLIQKINGALSSMGAKPLVENYIRTL